jgi:hypothetical protein
MHSRLVVVEPPSIQESLYPAVTLLWLRAGQPRWIATSVLDCHGAAVVMWEANACSWRAAEGAPLPFITVGFEVQFLRPTPLGPALRLGARFRPRT